MRIHHLALIIAACAAPVHAQNSPAEVPDNAAPALEVSGGAAIVSQYRFRGIGLSDEKPALQGWSEAEHESGVYAGFWGSSLDGFGELGGSNFELDLYAGYRTSVAEGVTLDAGLLYYAYPGSTGGDFEFFEPYARAGLDTGPASVTLGAAFAPEQDGIGGNSNIYLSAAASTSIPGTPLSLDASIGRSEATPR